MPHLIAVPPRLVRFAFYKTKCQAIIFPCDMEEMSVNNVVAPRHQIPFQDQKTAGK
jgi:hypothetical protein